MRVTDVELRDFRNYGRAAVGVGDGLSVIAGPNGAGKTNLLEAIYFGCVGRSPRTSNERELVRAGAAAARVVVDTVEDGGTTHRLEVGVEPGAAKVHRIDGSLVDSLSRTPARPLVSVFLPERLELVKGPPASRRAHLDSFVAAVWPARQETRAAYSRALAQRNALLHRIRAGGSSPATLTTWDAELARWAVQLMVDRAEAVALVAPRFGELAALLGLPETATLQYRPRSSATDADTLAAELADRHAADLERGFTAHGPHRDDVRLDHGGRSLRRYGSQGQQRVALLTLLFAERDVLRDQHGRTPVMLLDDVMSELDVPRRHLLAELLREGGQSLLTTTDAGHVPGARDSGVRLIEVEAGVATGPIEEAIRA